MAAGTVRHAESRFLLEWLPASVSAEAREQEPVRFQALCKNVATVVASAQSNQAGTAAWYPVLHYIPILNNFLETKQLFHVPDVTSLAQSLMQVVLNTKLDLEIQVRTAEALTKLLHSHKRVLSKTMHSDESSPGSASQQGTEGAETFVYEPPKLVIPWKPLLEMMVSLYGTPKPVLDGVGLASTRYNTLVVLIGTCRRYFEPEAVLELWQLLRPGIENVSVMSNDMYDSLGWLCLFAPTNQINRCGAGPANQLLQEWMSAWQQLACNTAWDAMWVGLLARLAKHDWQGDLDWGPHLASLYTHIISSFDVPVGTANSAPQMRRTPPSRIAALFSSMLTNLHGHLGRLCVALLRSSPNNPGTGSRAADAGARLTQLAALLDNYLHPSNTGRWCKELGAWLNTMVEEFMHQIGKQNPNFRGSGLSTSMQDLFVDVVLPLAARAQFSKDESLSRVAVNVLGHLAYIRPAKVLPLVVQRFRTALESSTATHQLSAAILTLARCVRPMLLSGWGMEEETGPQMLAEAMVALLPGLDANDESKTLAVIKFFVAVLSSAPGIGTEGELPEDLPDKAVRIPVYVEEWSDDLVSRLEALLENLDSGPGHRADAAAGRGAEAASNTGSASFLQQGSALFEQLAELMMVRLPSAAAKAAASRIVRFCLSESLPGVEIALSTLLCVAAIHHPDVVVKEFAEPALRRILDELTSATTTPGSMHDISSSLEGTLVYQMGQYMKVVWHLPHDTMRPLLDRTLQAVEAALQVASRPVQQEASALLRALCTSLTACDGMLPSPTLAPLGPDGTLLLEWVDRQGSNVEPLKWRPPPQDGTALAGRLIDTYICQAVSTLADLVSGDTDMAGSSTAHHTRLRIHAQLMKIKGVLAGFSSHLPDFKITPSGSSNAVPLHVAGFVSPIFGQEGLREQLAVQLTDIGLKLYNQHDPEALEEYLVVVESLMCIGSQEYVQAKSSPQKEPAVLSEPAAANMLISANMAAAGLTQTVPHRLWRKRVSPLTAAKMTDESLIWRQSQRAFRAWATTDMPAAPSTAQIPAEFRALLQAVICPMSTHPLRQARGEAIAILTTVVIRFSVLTTDVLPHFLRVLADVAQPPAASSPADTDVNALRDTLMAAAFRGVTPPPNITLLVSSEEVATRQVAVQGERDAQVEGAVQTMVHCLPFWRLMFRQVPWLECLLYTMIASRAHNSTVSQVSIGKLFINVLSRYIQPEAQRHDSPEFNQLAARMLHLANPATLRSSWRYCLAANILCLYLQPPPSAGAACLPFIRHHLNAILQPGCMPQLGRLSLLGLFVLLTRVVDHGERNDEMLSELRAWLVQPTTSQTLATLMASDHAKLETQEGGRDARGGLAAVQARLMNMTSEEMLLKVVTSSMERMMRRPEGGTGQEYIPEGIGHGLFEPGHAHMVHLLGSVLPDATAGAMKPLIERAAAAAAAQQVVNISEKAEQATAAECLAGMLSAGLPFLPGKDGQHAWVLDACTQQLTVCTLEMSEAWAVTLRYAVHGLLSIGHPPFKLYPHLKEAFNGSPAITAITKSSTLTGPQALQALQAVLEMSHRAGSLPSAHMAPRNSQGGAAVGGHVAVVKRLRCVSQCIKELESCASGGNSAPQQVLAYWSAVIDDVKSVLAVDMFSHRLLLGQLAGLLINTLQPHARPSSLTASDMDLEVIDSPAGAATGTLTMQSVYQKAADLRAALLAAFSAGCEVVQLLRRNVSPDAGHKPGSNGAGSAAASVTADSDVVMVDRPASPVTIPDEETVTESAKESRNGSPPSSDTASETAVSVALSRVGLGLMVVTWGAFHGNLAQMTTVFRAALPNLLRLQELAGPVLQKLAQDAMTAFITCKYAVSSIVPDLDTCNEVLSCLEDAATPMTQQQDDAAGGVEMWSHRAAALAFTQFWWFRSCFLLTPDMATRLQHMVQARLADAKPEVRAMAGATLSGMLRGMPPAAAEQLRQELLASARKLLVPAKKQQAAGMPSLPGTSTSPAKQLLSRHATVQGLAAFLQSSPYDCPPWTPSVILALVRPAAAHHGSGLEAAVRTAAAKALSEFKRTHEQDSMDALKAMMSADEWESFLQATSSGSYFS